MKNQARTRIVRKLKNIFFIGVLEPEEKTVPLRQEVRDPRLKEYLSSYQQVTRW